MNTSAIIILLNIPFFGNSSREIVLFIFYWEEKHYLRQLVDASNVLFFLLVKALATTK
jgi:hypothetical protein